MLPDDFFRSIVDVVNKARETRLDDDLALKMSSWPALDLALMPPLDLPSLGAEVGLPLVEGRPLGRPLDALDTEGASLGAALTEGASLGMVLG